MIRLFARSGRIIAQHCFETDVTWILTLPTRKRLLQDRPLGRAAHQLWGRRMLNLL